MNAMDTPVILVEDLVKSYDQVSAVKSLDLEVVSGAMYGLIGPDGAGKTTLLRVLCGLLTPDSGEVQVLGFNPITELARIKDAIGYMPQRFSLYPDLSVAENMRFFADIYRIPKQERIERTERLMQFSRLEPFKDRMAHALSGGMKQKLALSCTLMHTPKLLILDEPTTGVDPVSRVEFWNILRELKDQGVTILVTTPYMDEASLCDRAALMYDGKILAEGTPDQITERYPNKLIRVITEEAHNAAEALKPNEAFESVELYGDRVHVAVRETARGIDLSKELLGRNNVTYDSVAKCEPHLEDIFVHLVKQEE